MPQRASPPPESAARWRCSEVIYVVVVANPLPRSARLSRRAPRIALGRLCRAMTEAATAAK